MSLKSLHSGSRADDWSTEWKRDQEPTGTRAILLFKRLAVRGSMSVDGVLHPSPGAAYLVGAAQKVG